MSAALQSPPCISSDDARLLFVLLDSADEEGLLQNLSGEMLWRAAKVRLETGRYFDEGPVFWTLTDELDRSGAIDGKWIQERWRTVKVRVESSPAY